MNARTDVVTQDEPTAVQVAPDAISFIAMIERAARDPSVDIDKMERLMQMHERMMDKKAESDFNNALTACERELGSVSADATNPQTKSRYATYAKLDRALRPIYTAHGISISFGTEDCAKPEHVRVIAYVSKGGYTRVYRADMPADGKGAKGGDVMTKTHASGAAMAYGARYLLKGIFNIAVGENDDDGHGDKRGMPEGIKADFLAAIEVLTEREAHEQLWKRIAQSCKDTGDVEAYQELHAAAAKKLKALPKVPA